MVALPRLVEGPDTGEQANPCQRAKGGFPPGRTGRGKRPLLPLPFCPGGAIGPAFGLPGKAPFTIRFTDSDFDVVRRTPRAGDESAGHLVADEVLLLRVPP